MLLLLCPLQHDKALGQQACLIVRGSSLCQAPEVSGCWVIVNDSQAKPEMESAASSHQFNLCLPERMRLYSVVPLGAGEKAACQPSVLALVWLSSALMDAGSKSTVRCGSANRWPSFGQVEPSVRSLDDRPPPAEELA